MLPCDLRARPGRTFDVTVVVSGEFHRTAAERAAWVAAQHPAVVWDGPVLSPVSTTVDGTSVTVSAARSDYATVNIPDRAGVIPGLLGVVAVAVTPTGELLCVRRSDRVAVSPGVWGTTAGETVDDRDVHDGLVAPIEVARRSLTEELGLTEDEIFNCGAVRVYGVPGGANITVLCDITVGVDVVRARRAGVVDAWETDEVEAVAPGDVETFCATREFLDEVPASLALCVAHLAAR